MEARQSARGDLTADAAYQLDRKSAHGINVPLFWLKSQRSCGVGDFGDLCSLIEWCAAIRWQIIQLLPLCDTWDEPSPYSAICSLAINWIYLDVGAWLNDDDRVRARELNARATLSHLDVRAFKRTIVERAIENGRYAHSAEMFAEDHSWVHAYARFSAYKESLNSSAWWTWPQLDEKSASFRKRLRFFKSVQYLAYDQLRRAKDHAQTLNVQLKGDLPILMRRDSCDVWRHSHWFDPTQEVGAPPDFYAPDGQNWGFPPCNWPAMHEGGFSWWAERLKAADTCFHLYRLDHIAGFFRLWCIPTGCFGVHGRYVPDQTADWEYWGRKNLTALLKLGKALPIGEDLGTIPPIVRQVMLELGIPGTKVMRWERYWDSTGGYIPVEKYPFCSMTSVSTHDSPTLAQWWRESPQEARLFADQFALPYKEQLSSENRFAILRDSHRSGSQLHINLLLEYLPLFASIAPGVESQRINTPGVVSPDNWTRRSPVYFDEIKEHLGFQSVLRDLIGNAP